MCQNKDVVIRYPIPPTPPPPHLTTLITGLQHKSREFDRKLFAVIQLLQTCFLPFMAQA